MSKKDYILIAKAVAKYLTFVGKDSNCPLVIILANSIKEHNPSFDTSKFFDYIDNIMVKVTVNSRMNKDHFSPKCGD